MFERILNFLRRAPYIGRAVNYFVPVYEQRISGFLERCREFSVNERYNANKELLLNEFEILVREFQEVYDYKRDDHYFILHSPLILFCAMGGNQLNYADFFNVLKRNNFDFNITFPDDGEITSGNNALINAIAIAENYSALALLNFVTRERIDFNINCQDAVLQNTACILAIAKGYRDKSGDGKNLTVSNLELARKMIEDCAADVNLKNRFGYNALDVAVMRRDDDFIDLILNCRSLQKDTIENALDILSDPNSQGEDFLFDKSVNMLYKTLFFDVGGDVVIKPLEKDLFTVEKTEELKRKLCDRLSKYDRKPGVENFSASRVDQEGSLLGVQI